MNLAAGPGLSLVLWLASAGGAVVFFALGLLFGRRACAALQTECERAKAAGEEQRRSDFAARVALREQTEAVASALAQQRDKAQILENTLEKCQTERLALLEQCAEAQRQITASGTAEQTARHDLAVARELLQKQQERINRVEEANTSLRSENDGLVARAAHNDLLEREVTDLRARSLATEMLAPPRPALPGPHALDVLAAEMIRVHPIRAAVVGDDLGLVVACQGNHGDELAALGALFNRACSEAQRILPLRRIARIAIEDEGRTHLNVWPLRRAGTTGDEDQLTLVTLAHGFEPDPVRVAHTLARVAAGGTDAVIAT